MAQRRSLASKSTAPNGSTSNGSANHLHDHSHDHDHSHSHSHSLFHSHSHDEAHDHGAEKIMAALQGAGDRGSKVTIIGLLSNIGLTGAKGVAGWYLHSASLLADAGHSLSDLLGDLVVLFCWRLSRRPPTERYPFGFAKFEALGTTTVSLLLIGGALGIGFHSYNLLIHTLTETVSTLPSGPLQDAIHNVTIIAPPIPDVLSHDAHHDVVDPNAAWFAALSILAKEWLYRITKRVADDENSPVLLANAIHHRSDVYASAVALFAILGEWLFPAWPLDPLGGLLVSFVILRQSFGLLYGTWGDLTDAGVSPRTRQSLQLLVDPLVRSQTNASSLLAVSDIRARKAGSLMYVDLVAKVPPQLSMLDAQRIEEDIVEAIKKEKKEVAEVAVKLRADEPKHES